MNTKAPYFLLFTLLLAACGSFQNPDEIKLSAVTPDLALPLVNTSVTSQEIIEKFDKNGTVVIDAQGRVYLQYEGEVFSVRAEELIQIPDFPALISDTVTNLPFNLGGNEDLRTMRLKAGEMAYTISSNETEDVEVNLYLPEAGITQSVQLDYQGSIPVTVSGSIDLTNSEFLFPNGEVTLIYDARNQAGARIELPDFSINFQNLDFRYLEGYLGEYVFDLEIDTVDINFFDQIPFEAVYFEEPTLDILVSNSFGFPLRAEFNELRLETYRDGLLEVQSSLISQGVDFNYPSLSEVGQVATTLKTVDKTNSNLPQVIGSSPYQMYYDLDVRANPDGITTDNFVEDTSRFRVDVDLELPFWGWVDQVRIRDTFDMDLSDFEAIKEAQFKVISDNGFPVDMALQMFFVDESGQIFDSLFVDETKLLVAAPVDGNGLVTESTREITYKSYEGEAFERLKTGTKLILEASFTTINHGVQNVEIREEYSVDLKIGMIAGVELNEDLWE